MNVPQNVFCLFYAIFWGLIANAQIRWKAFDWPLALAGRTDKEFRPSRNRLIRSIWYLTFLPIALFLVIVAALKVPDVPPQARWEWLRWMAQILCAVVAALAAFGPYRLWLSGIERRPERFLYTLPDKNGYTAQPPDFFPKGNELMTLDARWSKGNLFAGFVYIGIGLLFGFGCRAV